MAVGGFIVGPDPSDPREIRFSTNPNVPPPIPADQIDLKSEVESMLVVIRVLYANDEAKFRQNFSRILSAAQGGLVGPNAEPSVAKDSLAVLKRDITLQEGGRIKNRYMVTLGKYALSIGFIFLVLSIILTMGLSVSSISIPTAPWFANFALLLTGSMAGVWLSFGARNVDFTFESLVMPERDRLEPAIRLIFSGLLTLIFGLMLSLKVVVIEIGPVSTDAFTQDGALAFLLGSFCGLSEQALTDTITKRALGIFGVK